MVTHKQRTGYRRTECGRALIRNTQIGDWCDVDCKQCLKKNLVSSEGKVDIITEEAFIALFGWVVPNQNLLMANIYR